MPKVVKGKKEKERKRPYPNGDAKSSCPSQPPDDPFGDWTPLHFEETVPHANKRCLLFEVFTENLLMILFLHLPNNHSLLLRNTCKTLRSFNDKVEEMYRNRFHRLLFINGVPRSLIQYAPEQMPEWAPSYAAWINAMRSLFTHWSCGKDGCNKICVPFASPEDVGDRSPMNTDDEDEESEDEESEDEDDLCYAANVVANFTPDTVLLLRFLGAVMTYPDDFKVVKDPGQYTREMRKDAELHDTHAYTEKQLWISVFASAQMPFSSLSVEYAQKHGHIYPDIMHIMHGSRTILQRHASKLERLFN